MRINNLKKILMLVQATGLSSAALLGQTYPIVVGNNTTADFTDLNYANQEKISEDPAAPAYSVSAVFVGNGSNVSISNSSFTNNYAEVANSSTVSTALVHSAVSDLTITDSVFRGNVSYSVYSSATSSTGVSGSVIKMFVGNRSVAETKGNLLVENVIFDSNQAISEYQAFGNVYVTNPNSAVFRNTTFVNNLGGGVEAGSINALGAALTGYGIGDTLVENSTFKGNIAISSYNARGAAIFANTEYSIWKDHNVSLNIRDTNFVGNSAIQVETEYTYDSPVWVAGGALYIAKSASTTSFQVEIADSAFSGNYVSAEGSNGEVSSSSGGGAIYSQSSDIKISATRDIVNVGNYAEIMGQKDDSRGGFLYLNGGSAEFAISEGAVMTIGDGRVGYDSIASVNSDSVISKTGLGALVVNSSMEYFTGTLNVNEGLLETTGKIGASQININVGANLTLTISSDEILSNADLNLDNQGTISMVARPGLRGNYTVAAKTGLDFGQVKAYGGTFADNLFSVNYAGEIAVGDSSGEPITITQNAVLSVVDQATSQPLLEMAFNVSSGNVSVNTIDDVTESLSEAIIGNYKYIAAYSFDVSMEEGDSVLLSFYIGDSAFSVGDFSVFYKGEDGEWIEAGDVSDITYDGEYFSFIVTHFSDYGFAAVPEPSTYAILLGMITLALVAYRRRK